MTRQNDGSQAAIRYSEAFKMTVVRELEQSQCSFEEMRRKYGIGGCATVQEWVRRYGNGTRGKVIRVETPEAINEQERLKQRVRLLERSLADANIELALERQFTRLACERAGIKDVAEFKKKRLGRRPWCRSAGRGLAWGERQRGVPEAGDEPAELLRGAAAAAAAAGGW